MGNKKLKKKIRRLEHKVRKAHKKIKRLQVEKLDTPIVAAREPKD